MRGQSNDFFFPKYDLMTTALFLSCTDPISEIQIQQRLVVSDKLNPTVYYMFLYLRIKNYYVIKYGPYNIMIISSSTYTTYSL